MASSQQLILQELSRIATCHIVDVGANPIGEAAAYSAMLEGGLARLTGFEPQPDALQRLNAAKGPNETYLPHVVGDGGEAVLNIYGGSGFASCFPIDEASVRLISGMERYTRKVDEIRLHSVRLDDCDAVDPIDFLKIDVQGSELAVIRNGREKLRDAVAIQTEVRFLPLYQGEPGFGELDRELQDQGFLLHELIGMKPFRLNSRFAGQVRRRDRRQLIDGDAIYLKDLRRIGDWSNRQVAALALLALSVFRDIDLALYTLEALEARSLVKAEQIESLATEWRL